ncbi:hypothetical protein HID58_079950 [Brassica napus]|uniref:Uncharacterized protein n=1 Tax=Brassica napus TaxID=3708 RepID=A0ABQ7Y4T3_BRANA|nr:hypothetical protein HID58_079950 [Brassica napus]
MIEIHDASKLRAHPLTDLDILDANTFQPMMDTIQNTESETVTENEYDTVDLEDDSSVPSRNQNETPSSYYQSSKRVYRSTLRSSSSERKR